MNLREFFSDYITRWEGGLSIDPADNGNWTGSIQGVGQLVGSNHGVTAAALAKHRKVAVGSISRSAMSLLTLDEAVDVAIEGFYKGPRFNILPWDGLIASAVDFGWGAGPVQSIKLLQRLIAVADDGQLGPYSARAYAEYVASHGIEKSARAWADQRNSFYDLIVQRRPVNAKYLKGWKNRTAYFAPGGDWWKRFNALEGKAA
jgi:lysozyme family protein